MIEKLLEWVFSHFGLAGLVGLASLGAVAWMLKLFVRSIKEVGSNQSTAMLQIVGQLQQQENGHKEFINVQVQHTEVLRSLVAETRALGDGIHQSELERSRQLTDLVARLIDRQRPG